MVSQDLPHALLRDEGRLIPAFSELVVAPPGYLDACRDHVGASRGPVDKISYDAAVGRIDLDELDPMDAAERLEVGLDQGEPELVPAEPIQGFRPELVVLPELQVLDGQLSAMPALAQLEDVSVYLLELETDLVFWLLLEPLDVHDLLVENPEVVVFVELDDRDSEEVRIEVYPQDAVPEEIPEPFFLLHDGLVVGQIDHVLLYANRDRGLLLLHEELEGLQDLLSPF